MKKILSRHWKGYMNPYRSYVSSRRRNAANQIHQQKLRDGNGPGEDLENAAGETPQQASRPLSTTFSVGNTVLEEDVPTIEMG